MSFNNDYDSFYRPTRNQDRQDPFHDDSQPLTGQVIDSQPQGGPGKRKSRRGVKVLAFALCGVLVFGESMTPRIACGIVLIVVAVTLIIAGNNITHTLVRFRKLFPRITRKHRGAEE